MNTRSIRFRLTAWYAGLLLVAALAFAIYNHQRLKDYLTEELVESLSSRAHKISDTLVAGIPRTGEDYVVSEVKGRYAPELNDRFIRVLKPDSSILYVSGIPNDQSFSPADVPVHMEPGDKQTVHEEIVKGGAKLFVVSNPVLVEGKRYVVECGASEAVLQGVLKRSIVTLAIGLPIFVGIAVLGGSLLVKWALAPVQRMMGAAQEITLHHLDKRLPPVRTGDEIEKLSNALNQMIGRLHASFQMSSRFTADASHELRTPLTIMRGELETLLLDKKLTPEVAEVLGSLFEETERLTRIVEGLLALSRLDAGEGQMKRMRLDLSALAATTAEQMCLLAVEKKIRLSCETNGCVEIDGDESKLKQVLVNLIDNAIKYTPEGGIVVLSVKTSGGRARVQVADSGTGIPQASLPFVFDRFYRADEVRSREVEGTGLGLSIVQSICAAHGGAIYAENRNGEGGAIFTVELPLAGHA